MGRKESLEIKLFNVGIGRPYKARKTIIFINSKLGTNLESSRKALNQGNKEEVGVLGRHWFLKCQACSLKRK